MVLVVELNTTIPCLPNAPNVVTIGTIRPWLPFPCKSKTAEASGEGGADGLVPMATWPVASINEENMKITASQLALIDKQD